MATAGAYVAVGGRFVFAFGLPRGASDRLGIARLGGHVEAGETAWQCAAREVLEEASLHAQPVAPPATYWLGPPYDLSDPAALAAGDWRVQGPGEPAPLLVAWREADGERRLSATYLATAEGTPAPAAETQGLLLLRPRDVLRLAREPLRLGTLLRGGAEAILRADLAAFDEQLPLEPLLQLRALAVFLERHPSLHSVLTGAP